MEEQKVEPFLKEALAEALFPQERKEEQPISPPTTSTSTAPYRVRYEKPKCAVCHEDGDGLHFGAEACRACTAFFRRSVALSKKYECRAAGNCEVAANIRCMCRACRYDKCIEVGMNPECVQNRRETLGKRDVDGVLITKPEPSPNPLHPPQIQVPTVPKPQPSPILSFSEVKPTPSFIDFSIFKPEPSASTSGFSPFSLPASLPGLSVITKPTLETMPLLERMRVNYEKMENARNVIHRRDGENIFQQKVPRRLNFREAADVTTREVSLVADWVEWCFDDFSVLPVDQKTILFQSFFIYFSMLEKGYMSVKHPIPGKENVIVLASKDYVDFENLEYFFRDCGDDNSMSPEELAKVSRLIKPSFERQKKSLVNLLRIEDVDIYEFFALCVMLFWDFGLEGQSDECNEVGRRVKNRVAREMTFYLRHVKKHEEPLVRMCGVAGVLPTLQRAVRRFQEDIEMAHLFNIYALPANFYNIVNGKFS